MRELEDLSHEEIAVALGITPAAAKQAIFEARRGLQEAGEGRAMACEEIRERISDGDGRVLRGRRVRAHLRDCPGCAAFAAAIPTRRAQLRAISPGLAPAAGAAILARALGGASTHHGGVALGTGAAGGASVGKGLLTAGLAGKLAAGAAVLATCAAGVGGVSAVVHLTRHSPDHRGAAKVQPASAARGRSAPTRSAAPASQRVPAIPAARVKRALQAERRGQRGQASTSPAMADRHAPAWGRVRAAQPSHRAVAPRLGSGARGHGHTRHTSVKVSKSLHIRPNPGHRGAFSGQVSTSRGHTFTKANPRRHIP